MRKIFFELYTINQQIRQLLTKITKINKKTIDTYVNKCYNKNKKIKGDMKNEENNRRN